jgi:hypothetical protein
MCLDCRGGDSWHCVRSGSTGIGYGDEEIGEQPCGAVDGSAPDAGFREPHRDGLRVLGPRPQNACAVFGSPDLSCTVGTDTKLFVVGWSTECSTFDNDCSREKDPPGPCGGTTLDDLLACAIEMDVPAHETPTITVDGKSVKVTEVTTTMPNLVLTNDNIFGDPDAAGAGQSAAHGWVALVGPLSPGSHEIVITDPAFPTATRTKIVVKPGH